MVVTESGITIDAMSVFANAFMPIEVTLFGMVSWVSAVHPSNVKSLMARRPEGSVADVKLWAFWNT